MNPEAYRSRGLLQVSERGPSDIYEGEGGRGYVAERRHKAEELMSIATAAACALALAVASPTVAAPPFRCALGQSVVDRENKIGVIVAVRNHLCRVEYPDGEAYPWIDWDRHPAGAGVLTIEW
jgi:hypothetical protein